MAAQPLPHTPKGKRDCSPKQRSSNGDPIGGPHARILQNEVGIFVLVAEQTLIELTLSFAIDGWGYSEKLR